jgi:ATP-dependent helicase HrpA
VVAGLGEGEITALIETLSRALRPNFVPAPEFAKACLQALAPQDRPLHECLGEQLHRMTGVAVPADAWRFDVLPAHLFMNFHIVDAGGRVLARGRDFEALRDDVRDYAEESFTRLPGSQWERDDIKAWDFDNLPETVEIEQHGVTLKGFPALVAEDGRVNLRLLDAPGKAAATHREGVLQLFRRRAAQGVKYLEKNLPGQQALCLLYAAVGPCEELKADLLRRVLDAALYKDGEPIRTRTGFEQAADRAEGELVSLANDYAAIVKDVLQAYREVNARLKGSMNPQWLASMHDIQSQLAHLVYPGFIRATPAERLAELPRYLQAAAVRLDKLARDPQRDTRLMNEVAPFWRACEAALDSDTPPRSAEFDEFRWLVEEFRVSLFAQTLGTKETVSAKRLEKARKAAL